MPPGGGRLSGQLGRRGPGARRAHAGGVWAAEVAGHALQPDFKQGPLVVVILRGAQPISPPLRTLAAPCVPIISLSVAAAAAAALKTLVKTLVKRLV